MNDGYVSYILIVVTIVLLSSGWRHNLAGTASRAELALFFFAWMSGLFYTIPIGTEVRIQGVYIALALLLFGAFRRMSRADAAYAVVSGVLAGLIGYCLHLLFRIDPVLILHDPKTDIAAAVGLIAFLVSGSVYQQAVVWSVACVIIDILTGSDASSAWLGKGAFQDSWWIAFLSARALSILRELAVSAATHAVKRMASWMRFLRK